MKKLEKNKYFLLDKYIKKNNYIFYFLVLFVLCIHQIIFQNLIIFDNAKVAEEHYLGLPNLVFGKIWYLKNGLFELPHFIVSQGGGIPLYADPQSVYFSIFQILILLNFKLETVLKISFFLFSLIGFFGTYLLLRNLFKFDRYVSVFCATLFIFNGFFVNRYLIGHTALAYYNFLPLYCFLLFSSVLTKNLYVKKICLISSSIIFSILIFGGAIGIFVKFTYSIFILVLIFYIVYRNFSIFLNLIYSILLSLLISLSSISYKIYFYSQFPRVIENTTILNNLGSFLYTSLTSFFLIPDPFFYEKNQASNIKTYLSIGELEFGLSIVSLILLVVFLIKIEKFYKKKDIVLYFLLFLAFLLPVFYIVEVSLISNFLSKIPILNATWTRNRWLLVYIFPLIIINAFVIKKIFSGKYTLIIIFILIPIFQTLLYHELRNKFYPDKSFRAKAVYSIVNLENFSNSLTKETVKKLHVKYIEYLEDQNRLDKNEGFMHNTSKLYSYSPIFGYRLEKLPLENIIKKRANYFSEIKIQNGKYDLFNPICFLFPKENNCIPGDKFTIDQKDNFQKFVNYKPLDFNIPLKQIIANYVSLFSIIILLITLSILIFLLVNSTILKKKNSF